MPRALSTARPFARGDEVTHLQHRRVEKSLKCCTPIVAARSINVEPIHGTYGTNWNHVTKIEVIHPWCSSMHSNFAAFLRNKCSNGTSCRINPLEPVTELATAPRSNPARPTDGSRDRERHLSQHPAGDHRETCNQGIPGLVTIHSWDSLLQQAVLVGLFCMVHQTEHSWKIHHQWLGIARNSLQANHTKTSAVFQAFMIHIHS